MSTQKRFNVICDCCGAIFETDAETPEEAREDVRMYEKWDYYNDVGDICIDCINEDGKTDDAKGPSKW